MTDSHSAPDAQAGHQSHKPSTIRLVIRAEILPDRPVPLAAPQRRNKRTVAGIAAATVVLALIGIGILLFTSAPEDVPPGSAPAPVADVRSAQAEARAPASTPVQSAAPMPQEQPTVATREVLPDPSQSALQTIRGTVRVSIRVTIDGQGAVSAAVPEDPGPSRYFERLSTAAARQWMFTPAHGDEPRSRLLRFHFTQEGTTVLVDDYAVSDGA